MGAGEGEITKTEAVTAQSAVPNSADIKNGKVDGKPVSPQNVQVEVGSANATEAQPQTAEPVKVKDKPKGKCKCCVIQ